MRPVSRRVPLTRMAPDNAVRRRSHSTSARKRDEVIREPARGETELLSLTHCEDFA